MYTHYYNIMKQLLEERCLQRTHNHISRAGQVKLAKKKTADLYSDCWGGTSGDEGQTWRGGCWWKCGLPGIWSGLFKRQAASKNQQVLAARDEERESDRYKSWRALYHHLDIFSAYLLNYGEPLNVLWNVKL